MMARHVTIRRTQTTTEELRPPWQYVLLGMVLLAAGEGAILCGWWLLANFNF